MTNDQAKKMLKAKLECLKRETSGTDFDCNNSNCDECSLCYEQGNMGEQKEALDMAIKALEKEPCEDTISRKEALDALHMCLSTNSYDDDVTGDSYICYEEAEYEIENLPPVRPKTKMGHWIYEKRKRLINETDESAEYVTDYWCKCSKCGGDFGYRKMKDAFCKYCGAKMVKPQERSDKE